MVRPTEMQALVVERANGPFVMTRLPSPTPGAHQALVRVLASGVNPLDTKIRAGTAAHARVAFPAVLGLDLAGVVEGVGYQVTEFREGDEVYAMGGGVGGLQGSLATHIAVDADLLALKPKNLSMREAAAMPLSVITAWEGLVDRAHVHEGNTVLVHGGAGGVGHIAVQIALALGAKVFATVSKGKMTIVESYGATAINYQEQQVESYVAEHTGSEGFDIVYDTVGGTTLDDSFTAAKIYTGHVVSCLGWGTHRLAVQLQNLPLGCPEVDTRIDSALGSARKFFRQIYTHFNQPRCCNVGNSLCAQLRRGTSHLSPAPSPYRLRYPVNWWRGASFSALERNVDGATCTPHSCSSPVNPCAR